MHHLTEPITPQAVFTFAQQWLHLLCARQYSEASKLLFQGGENEWTSELIQEGIETYGFDETTEERYFATTAEDAKGENPREHYDDSNPDAECFLHPKLPILVSLWSDTNPDRPTAFGDIRLHYALNGTWSDLSSEFLLHRIKGQIVIELRSIEVQ